MKAVRIFNPPNVMGNKIFVGDVDNLKFFKLIQHPDIRPRLARTKEEISKYNALAEGIKALDERKDAKGNDTFVLCDWWRCNSGELPHFASVLHAVLTHSPKSCPPTRLFGIFNATFDADQRKSFGVYIELSMRSHDCKRDV